MSTNLMTALDTIFEAIFRQLPTPPHFHPCELCGDKFVCGRKGEHQAPTRCVEHREDER